MSRYSTVYFFGAGASRALGVPTTPELLPAILKYLANGRLFEASGKSSRWNKRVRTELRANLECLFPSLDPQNAPPITDLFSLMDELIAQQQAATPSLTAERLQQLRRQLERATLWVVANHRARGTARGVRTAVHRFFDRVVDHGRLRKQPSCFITTNYDRIIESCLLRNGSKVGAEEVDYGVNWRAHAPERVVPRPTKAPIGIFKLHGSATWLGCPLCGHIYIRSSMCIYTVAYWAKTNRHNTCHCGYAPLRTVTVAPSLRHVLVGSSLPVCGNRHWRP